MLFAKLEYYVKASILLEEALKGFRKKLGVDHASTYWCLECVTHVKQDLEDEDCS